jgi:hypothetical protein
MQPAKPPAGDEDGDANQAHPGLPLIGLSSCHLSAFAAYACLVSSTPIISFLSAPQVAFSVLHKLLLHSATYSAGAYSTFALADQHCCAQ